MITRYPSGALATLGCLDIDGDPFCYTLEDVVRPDPNPATPANEAKVYGETAIPSGRYRLDITYSPKFRKPMILVKDVPGFTGIRIHSGNDADDTLGCILVGSVVDGDNRIHGGSEVMPRLFGKVQAALDRGEAVWLTIENVPPVAA